MDITELILTAIVEFVAAFTAVFLAYRLGIRQDRAMRREEEKEDIIQIVNSLLIELEFNMQFIEKSKNVKERYPRRGETFVYTLTSSSFDSVVFSGKFHLLSHETQRKLTWHYDGIKKWNIMGNMYTAETENKGRPETETVSKVIKLFDALNESIPDMKTTLENELFNQTKNSCFSRDEGYTCGTRRR